MSDTNEASVQSVVRRPVCRCGGYQFFWGSEIRGWRGKEWDQVSCIDCAGLFWFDKLWLRWYGYTSNEQIQSDFLAINRGS
jgi:hypothetical protein